MNKKLFQSVVAIVALLFGATALAQPTATTPNANYPLVAPGGTVVFENQVITDVGGADLDIDDKVILTLPTGTNFVGTPVATVSGATTLRLSSNSLGDPGTLGLVTLNDTDGDGGNDRAEITVKVAGTAADTVTFTGSMTYTGTSTTGNLSASVSVFDKSANIFSLAGAANVLATKTTATKTVAPIALQSASTVYTLPNATASAVANAVSYLITVPSGVGGAAAGADNTLTFTLGTGLKLDATTTATFTTLTDDAPSINNKAALAASEGVAAFSVDLNGKTTRSSQYLVVFNVFDTAAQASPTIVNYTISGDAGLAGNAIAASLASTGSTTALATGATKASLVKTADAAQTLPTFEIVEIFPNDFADGETITLVAPTGVTFVGAGTAISDDALAATNGGAANTANANTIQAAGKEILITLTNTEPTKETYTIAGITATAGSTAATGDISITVGKSVVGESSNAPFKALAVATGSAVGTVTATGPTTAGKVGAGTAGNAGTISLSESTYGAIATNSTFPFIQISPPTGITITGVVATPPGGSTLAFGPPTAAVPADGSWVVPVNAESSTKILATAPATLVVTYSVGSTVASGTAVTFTLGGDVNVTGSVNVANVVDTTTTSVLSGSVIPDKETSIDFTAAGTISVKEEFAAALSNAAGTNFRIIAPAGITFASTQPAPTAPATALTVDTTFSANDTLLVTMTGTAGTDTINVAPNVFISGSAAMGFNTFTVSDGNTNDTNGAGVTSGSADILYVGTVASPDAGADITVGAGVSVNRTVTGGLADLTVASADAGVATATITGSTIKITGVSAGATTVTVTDALNVTDAIAVTVVATAPPAKTSEASDGSVTDAVVSGGISTDNGSTFATDGVVSVGDAISIIATIQVDTADVGEELDILVAVLDPASGEVLLIDDAGALVPVGDPLAAFDTRTLAATETVDVLGGSFTLTSAESGISVEIYVGYLRADGVVIFNSEAIPLTVQ